MAIPVSIDNIIRGNVVESARIEYKESWYPDASLKTISAFANDLDNWGGGYLVIGVQERNGLPVRPVKGLKDDEIDDIQKDILRCCKFISPAYVPQCQPVELDGRSLLLIWCPGGYDRPYKCPKKPTQRNSQKIYYIRKMSSTIEATDIDVKELMALSRNIPFDDRINPRGQMSDLKYPLIRDFLMEADSGLLAGIEGRSLEEIASDMRIAEGPREDFKPLNVGLMFFNDDPEKFFPYTRIEVVNIPDPTGQGMEERTFRGPIHRQLKDALLYLRNTVIAQRVYKQPGKAEAIRVWNYSYQALEEFLSNAVYHRSYQLYEPVTVRIESDSIEITSAPGPDRSISDEDIAGLRMKTRRYRNRRIGDFLKELHMVEGRNTGIPTALRSIRENGSPLPEFITDDDRSFFSVVMPIHRAFIDGERRPDISMYGEISSKEEGPRKEARKHRRSRKEIRELILEQLAHGDMSENQLYHSLGYSGGRSRTFKECLDDLLKEDRIEYADKNSISKKD